ncbi:MAG: selenocysteine-specific translation elongation factor [Burkholderiales bacterium]|nr:selenocysteine-specific translation elongation factor [Burkholderiales bacterium]
MIVATAGHIDHGKTLLVKALSGVDTDRLPEEKSRGISIDLGFAYLAVPGAGLLGFVDVPGHERFVRNMLAGVCGIDLALLVIAADDGIMPQTVEHLQILDLLNVARGIVAITKIDRVSEARVAEVSEATRRLIAGSALEGAALLPVSALAGTGIEALRSQLFAEARQAQTRAISGRRFRYAIDRVFSVSGSGTVVTGTVFNGSVKIGDRLLISPPGLAARVRGIQVHGKAAEQVGAGSRCALNLAGEKLDKDALRRGDWVLDETLHKPTRRFDATVKVLKAEAQPLAHWTPVHCHLGTEAVTGRVAVRRGESIAPGESHIAQIILDRPIGCLHGDRFILRDQSATRTIGGGTVADPFAPALRRNSLARQKIVAALATESAEEALRQLSATANEGIDVSAFETAFNLDQTSAAALYRQLDIVVFGRSERIGISAARHEQLAVAIVDEVLRLHREDPKSLGLELASLPQRLQVHLPEWLLTQIARELAHARKVEISGTRVRRPGHDATSNPEDERLWQRVLPALQKDVPLPPSVRELSEQLRLPEKALSDFLHRKSRAGEPIKTMPDRFLLRSTVERLAQTAEATAGAKPNGQFTAADYRDHCGASRKLAIEVLEYFDRIGFTQRIGDVRRIRRPLAQALAASPGAAASRAKA